MSVTDLVPRHDEPFYNLIEEPWIPVMMVDGTNTTLSLGSVLFYAHEIARPAVDDPITSYGLRRFLNALGWMAYSFDPGYDWVGVARDGAPLPRDAVERVIDRISPCCWLLHPDTPFLQVAELRSCATTARKRLEDVTFEFGSMHSHIPSGNNEAWWYRQTDAATTPAAAALGLLARHIAATPGNETDVRTLAGEKTRRTEGGLLLAGPRDVTHVWWEGPTLSSQMITSLLADDAERLTPNSTPFFQQPLAGVAGISDPLYRYTYSGSSSFLAPTGSTYRVLRCPTPIGTVAAKRLAATCRLHDPHSLWMPKSDGKATVELSDATLLAFNPSRSQFANVFDFYRRAGNVKQLLPSVLDPGRLMFPPTPGIPLGTISVATSGPATGLRIDSSASRAVRSDPFLLDPARAAAFRSVVGRLGDSSKSVRSILKYRIHEALAAGAKGGLETTQSRAKSLLWNALESSIGAIYQEFLDLPDDSLPTGLDEERKREWIATALEIYSTVCEPYMTSARHRASVIKNRIEMKGSLWKTL
jgi:hypothetical protein